MHKAKAVDDGSEAVTATTATTKTTDSSLATAVPTGGDDRRRLHGGERLTGAERGPARRGHSRDGAAPAQSSRTDQRAL